MPRAVIAAPLIGLALLTGTGAGAAAQVLDVPDLVSLGGGYLGIRKTSEDVRGGDARFEYRSGTSLLPLLSSSLKPLDRYFQIRPSLGAEITTRGAIYGYYSFVLDIPITSNFYIGWNEGVGYYYPLDGVPRGGGSVEFRTQFEAGWIFDNGMRLSGFLSHISNARLNNTHFSGDAAGLYLHVPTGWIFRP
jgi:hypothetical protein